MADTVSVILTLLYKPYMYNHEHYNNTVQYNFREYSSYRVFHHMGNLFSYSFQSLIFLYGLPFFVGLELTFESSACQEWTLVMDMQWQQHTVVSKLSSYNISGAEAWQYTNKFQILTKRFLNTVKGKYCIQCLLLFLM